MAKEKYQNDKLNMRVPSYWLDMIRKKAKDEEVGHSLLVREVMTDYCEGKLIYKEARKKGNGNGK